MEEKKSIFDYGYFEKDGMLYRHTQYGDRFVTDNKADYKYCLCGEIPSMEDVFKRENPTINVNKTMKNNKKVL